MEGLKGLTSNAESDRMFDANGRYWELGEHHYLMHTLARFMASVLETDHVPFDLRDSSGIARAVRRPIGARGFQNLSTFLPLSHQLMDLYWEGYAYSADIQLFFDCYRTHTFALMQGDLLTVERAGSYNKFIAYIRHEARRRRVKKTMLDSHANRRAQGTSIRDYLGGVHSLNRFLDPLRVDFFYGETAFDVIDMLPRKSWIYSEGDEWRQVRSSHAGGFCRPETRARIDTAVALADRDAFFDNRRGSDHAFFDRMAGYVCKLEQGGASGANHFHCVFLMDSRGMRREEREALKRVVEDRWRRMTRGLGWMYDCHQRPDRAELIRRGYWAIEPVDAKNPEQLERFIDYVVYYFAKENGQAVRIKPTAKTRTLTMGRLESR